MAVCVQNRLSGSSWWVLLSQLIILLDWLQVKPQQLCCARPVPPQSVSGHYLSLTLKDHNSVSFTTIHAQFTFLQWFWVYSRFVSLKSQRKTDCQTSIEANKYPSLKQNTKTKNDQSFMCKESFCHECSITNSERSITWPDELIWQNNINKIHFCNFPSQIKI